MCVFLVHFSFLIAIVKRKRLNRKINVDSALSSQFWLLILLYQVFEQNAIKNTSFFCSSVEC